MYSPKKVPFHCAENKKTQQRLGEYIYETHMWKDLYSEYINFQLEKKKTDQQPYLKNG